MIEPTHVGRAALVALGVDPHAVLLRAEDDHAALAGRDLLVRVEAEDRRMPAAADRRAVRVHRAERLAGVLDDREAVALQRRHVGRVAEDVDGQQRARAPVIAAAAARRVEVERDRVDVGEHRPRALVEDRVRRGDERERRRDDLLALPHADGAQREVQAGRAGRDGAQAWGAPSRAANAASNAGTRGPSESWPERRTSSTSSSSRAPMTGRASGMTSSSARVMAPASRRPGGGGRRGPGSMPASSESTSASQLASITFSLTPIAPQRVRAVGRVDAARASRRPSPSARRGCGP